MKKVITLAVCLLLCAVLAACDVTEIVNQFAGNLGVTDPVSTADPSDSKPAHGETEGHVHSFGKWQTVKEATCAENGSKERTCACGETETDTIWQVSHRFTPATCAAPKTCRNCGATEGEKISHNWRNATCKAPRTCGRCGATEGKANDHQWNDATCLEPKRCALCGTVEGGPAAHKFVQGRCQLCGEGDPDNWPLDHSGWWLYAVTGNKITRWEIYFDGTATDGQGRLCFLDGDNIKTLTPDRYEDGNVIEFQGERYFLSSGDEGPMTYTVKGSTITVKAMYSDTAITLERLPGNQLKVVKISGPWAIPAGGIYQLNR